MTREEAIKVLNMVEAHGLADEAKRVAIKALKQESCEDAISRAEALKAIEKEKQGWEGAERYAIDECHSRIAELPSVTPHPKTGHWIATGNYFKGAYSSIDYVECSCCGYESLEEGNYCPNCGARMED